MLVVDAANVIGSRPDGWWRDRAGAARRLHDRLTCALAAGTLEAPVVLVLEGAARAGVEPSDTEPPVEPDTLLTVVHATRSGDDAIVEIVAGTTESSIARSAGDAMPPPPPTPTAQVTVVTADRGLRERVVTLGATVAGPGWLLDLLDRSG